MCRLCALFPTVRIDMLVQAVGCRATAVVVLPSSLPSCGGSTVAVCCVAQDLHVAGWLWVRAGPATCFADFVRTVASSFFVASTTTNKQQLLSRGTGWVGAIITLPPTLSVLLSGAAARHRPESSFAPSPQLLSLIVTPAYLLTSGSAPRQCKKAKPLLSHAAAPLLLALRLGLAPGPCCLPVCQSVSQSVSLWRCPPSCGSLLAPFRAVTRVRRLAVASHRSPACVDPC